MGHGIMVKDATKECITIMDEAGRDNPEGNSTMLWHHEWEEIREKLFKAFIELDKNIEINDRHW